MATTSGLTYHAPPLAAPSDTTLAVRAFDAASGIEEANTDARVRIVLDASGNDVTASPGGVLGLAARPMAGGACWVAWSYNPAGQGGPPARFDVFLAPAGSPWPATPAASVGSLPGQVGYGCSLPALGVGPTASIGVRAVGPSAWLVGPMATIAIACPNVALADVDGLTATPTP